MAKTKQIHVLLGDKMKQSEAEEHYIKFPGGYIAVMRTTDNKYWAHIGVHSEAKGDPVINDTVVESKFGMIESIRTDHHNLSKAVDLIKPDENLYHIAA